MASLLTNVLTNREKALGRICFFWKKMRFWRYLKHCHNFHSSEKSDGNEVGNILSKAFPCVSEPMSTSFASGFRKKWKLRQFFKYLRKHILFFQKQQNLSSPFSRFVSTLVKSDIVQDIRNAIQCLYQKEQFQVFELVVVCWIFMGSYLIASFERPLGETLLR